jgi:acyl carrier protein
MGNAEIYDQVFIEVFGLSVDDLNPLLAYQSVSSWDSVGHMALIGELESRFQILLEMDDIIDFSSYQVGKEILRKYQVDL